MDLPKNVVELSSHPKWKTRLRNKSVLANTQPTALKGPVNPTNRTPSITPDEAVQSIGMVLRSMGHHMADLHKEGVEQRAILRALVGCVGDLKLLVDNLAKRMTSNGKQVHD
jgi:hypothetical protein